MRHISVLPPKICIERRIAPIFRVALLGIGFGPLCQRDLRLRLPQGRRDRFCLPRLQKPVVARRLKNRFDHPDQRRQKLEKTGRSASMTQLAE
jgi:hypothetical protein